MQTVRIDVHVNYQGTTSNAYSYLIPINEEEYDDPDYMFDDYENKTGFRNACKFINVQMT